MKTNVILLFIIANLLNYCTVARTIQGTVKDENGALVTKGSVQIMGTNKRIALDENGQFRFENVTPGTFELHVSSINHIHNYFSKITVNERRSLFTLRQHDSHVLAPVIGFHEAYDRTSMSHGGAPPLHTQDTRNKQITQRRPDARSDEKAVAKDNGTNNTNSDAKPYVLNKMN